MFFGFGDCADRAWRGTRILACCRTTTESTWTRPKRPTCTPKQCSLNVSAKDLAVMTTADPDLENETLWQDNPIRPQVQTLYRTHPGCR
jgi:hypothetical protein